MIVKRVKFQTEIPPSFSERAGAQAVDCGQYREAAGAIKSHLD
jgi:hypothetical protein